MTTTFQADASEPNKLIEGIILQPMAPILFHEKYPNVMIIMKGAKNEPIKSATANDIISKL